MFVCLCLHRVLPETPELELFLIHKLHLLTVTPYFGVPSTEEVWDKDGSP